MMTWTDTSAERDPRSGQECRILARLWNVDDEVGPMYLVVFDDGQTVEAFADELDPEPEWSDPR